MNETAYQIWLEIPCQGVWDRFIQHRIWTAVGLSGIHNTARIAQYLPTHALISPGRDFIMHSKSGPRTDNDPFVCKHAQMTTKRLWPQEKHG